jgi:hypothetical protein
MGTKVVAAPCSMTARSQAPTPARAKLGRKAVLTDEQKSKVRDMYDEKGVGWTIKGLAPVFQGLGFQKALTEKP